METIIRFVLRSRLLMGVLGILVLAAGWFSYKQLPVDAFPDVTPALVQVFTETEGLAPEEVEKFVTYPVETAMNGLPNLKEIRSISNFGLSVINIYFEDGTDIYFARQLVGERLQMAREEIPEGFGDPEMGPIATGLGQILFFVVEDEKQSRTPEEMREIQDWLIKFNLQTVPGVTEVLSLGGEVKQFQVRVRPADLLRYDLTINEIKEKVEANNGNAGAQFLVKNAEEYIIRSVGLAEKIGDLERIVLKVQDGTPVYLNQVAHVVIGGEIRRGLATMNGKGEVVVGMVLKLIGTNTSTVIADVKAKLEEINRVLPEGVKVVRHAGFKMCQDRHRLLDPWGAPGGWGAPDLHGRIARQSGGGSIHPVLHILRFHPDEGFGHQCQLDVSGWIGHCHRHDGGCDHCHGGKRGSNAA